MHCLPDDIVFRGIGQWNVNGTVGARILRYINCTARCCDIHNFRMFSGAEANHSAMVDRKRITGLTYGRNGGAQLTNIERDIKAICIVSVQGFRLLSRIKGPF